jgi:MSHA pilin protein MshC
MSNYCYVPDKRAALRRAGGFTMVELIAVLVIMGILAVVAAPRFFDRGTFDSRGFYDQVISSLRYAQKEAIAQRHYICVKFDSNNSITLSLDPVSPDPAAHPAATCPGATPLASPAGDASYNVTNSHGVTLSGYNDFYFDALGRPFPAQSITVSGLSAPITVEAETGYVH